MLAQIVLTPAESKKLIAKAIARLEVVQQAAKNLVIVALDCSTTGTKAIAFDKKGRIAAAARRQIRFFLPSPDITNRTRRIGGPLPERR